jgi:hypothetical protein
MIDLLCYVTPSIGPVLMRVGGRVLAAAQAASV